MLVELAKTLGWHITLIGSRPQAALRQSFPSADQTISTENPAETAADNDHLGTPLSHGSLRVAVR